MSNHSDFVKLGPLNRPLGKKGDGVMFFTKCNLFPKNIPVPNLPESNEALWQSIRPRVLHIPTTAVQ